MNTLAMPGPITADEFLKLPDTKGAELVDGQIVEKHMGTYASLVGGEILGILRTFSRQTALGWVFNPEASYQCFPDRPNLIRKPDVSLVRYGRFPNEIVPTGHARIPPDLTVEVVSPNDLFYEVERKTIEYLQAGVRMAWVVNPDTRTVHVYGADGSFRWLRESDKLTGGDVLPGFHCLVRDFFPSPPTQAGSQLQG